MTGVTAALLAREGFTGELSVLDGDKGLWRTMGAQACDWAVLTDRLGERWRVEEVAYKAYPACRFIAPLIDMFRAIIDEHRLTLEEIGGSALYLLSDLSAGVTGEIHHIDAGYNIISMPRPEHMKTE